MSGLHNNQTTMAALPVGYQFNEFEIKEVIGGGGFGIVYRVWDSQLERMGAIKEYMPGSMAVRNEDMTLGLRSERFSKIFHAGLNSFIQEARLLANFNHPCLLHVLRFWQNNGTAYMATLLYSGQTLKLLQQKEPQTIDEDFIRQLLPPLFSALKTLHNAGYLHRDISLDNIQIQENALPVLLDFGSARKEIGNLSDETEIMLKPGYAPIEQYTDDGDGEQGPWTDIYALGAVLYTLIVGEAPPGSVVRSIEDTLLPLAELQLDGYSPNLLSAIDKALALAPADRPQSVDELANLMTLPIATARDVLDTLHPTAADSLPLAPVVTHPDPMQTRAANSAINSAEPSPGKPRSGIHWKLAAPVGALTVILIATLLWHRGASDENSPPQQEVAQVSNAQPVVETAAVSKAPTASSTLSSSQTQSPAASPAASTTALPTPAAAIANVYLKLNADDALTLDGNKQNASRGENGQVKLVLTAGEHKLIVERQGKQYPQSLTIDKPGTWFLASIQ